jgi:putative transcriptional regulator
LNYQPAGFGKSDAEGALLAAYAAGTLSRPMHALVAGHLELSPRNRAFAAGLEAMLAVHIDNLETKPLLSRDRRLAEIFAVDADDACPGHAAARPNDALPSAIAAFAGGQLDSLRWRSVLPGVSESRIPCEAGFEASFYRIRAGRKLPSHTHEGLEATLVLKGAFSDINGHYRTGDIAIADDDVDHRPVADADEGCLCFAVSEGGLRLTGPVGRLLRLVSGRA